ncbi:MAG: carboxylating nicotinate-nucleotide diphosphorylase [Nevskiales bacterium]
MDLKLPDNIAAVVTHALAEDVGGGDLTAQLIPSERNTRAQVISRETAVLCGQAWFDETFRQCDAALGVRWQAHDGETIAPNQVLCVIEGPARPMLTAERTALNFLQTLSGTATLVRRYADKVRGTKARILDTRKTIPGLRTAQKYAVRCGGGHNHRHGLYDGILIKENHIIAAGSIAAAVQAAFRLAAGVPVQVEAENLAQVEEALQAGADMILLDNFPIHQLSTAVRLRQRFRLPDGSYPLFEASGNIDLSNVRLVADAGVDRISIGSLTKHINAIDLSMRFEL